MQGAPVCGYKPCVMSVNLSDNRRCFACGPANPIGLHLDFRMEGDRIHCEFMPHPDHQGYAGITHGGILATVLDEAMARLLWDQGQPVVTGSFEMRLKAQARAGETLLVEAWEESRRGRFIRCAAEMRKTDGTLVAASSGAYVQMPATAP